MIKHQTKAQLQTNHTTTDIEEQRFLRVEIRPVSFWNACRAARSRLSFAVDSYSTQLTFADIDDVYIKNYRRNSAVMCTQLSSICFDYKPIR